MSLPGSAKVERGPSFADRLRTWRERGTPGWAIVARKELADHLLSVRFTVLVAILGLVAIGATYAVASGIRDAATEASEVPALFLRLFTFEPAEGVPSFLSMVGFLAPLLGIAFGFDAVNGERAQGTLPRLVSQPIHRDDVINGKFVAGLAVIGATLLALMLVIAGIGLLRLGIVPSGADIWRMLFWWALTLVYVGFWLGLAVLCSVALRRAATSALVAIASWLVLTLFAGILFGLAADLLSPLPEQPLPQEELANARMEQRLQRLSPTTLYEEATLALLRPEIKSFRLQLFNPLDQSNIPTGTLSLDQSLIVALPQTVGLVALTVLLFAAAYVLFMRQEIRA
ncbi:MAG TPA: ABC transporter permease [Actinomycetota bacterium]|nr:ABC transporter permease [Actinomycetota bacterium]